MAKSHGGVRGLCGPAEEGEAAGGAGRRRRARPARAGGGGRGRRGPAEEGRSGAGWRERGRERQCDFAQGRLCCTDMQEGEWLAPKGEGRWGAGREHEERAAARMERGGSGGENGAANLGGEEGRRGRRGEPWWRGVAVRSGGREWRRGGTCKKGSQKSLQAKPIHGQLDGTSRQ